MIQKLHIWSGMNGSMKSVVLIFLIITSCWKLFVQDIKSSRLIINVMMFQNDIFEHPKGQIWILENFFSNLSDVENEIISRPFHLWLSSFTNFENS